MDFLDFLKLNTKQDRLHFPQIVDTLTVKYFQRYVTRVFGLTKLKSWNVLNKSREIVKENRENITE